MSSPMSPVSNVDSLGQFPQPAVDENRLGVLAGRWQSHESDGIDLRFETGKFLLDMIGPPQHRQKYGNEVMLKVSVRLSVSVSELSRMRSFAHLCPNLAEFRETHPEHNSWTKIKALLPLLAGNQQEEVRQVKSEVKKCTLVDVHSSITKLQKALAVFAPDKGVKSKKLRIELTALRQKIDSLLESRSVNGAPQEPVLPMGAVA
jgi:hypothetical protein